ncbi:MAG: FAD-binding protein, partial [Leptospira sp.]|nr:FAD-binding protein [Leptospira sp.]
MPLTINTRILPEHLFEPTEFQKHIATTAKLSPGEIQKINLSSRSIDARQKTIYYQITAEVFTKQETYSEEPITLPDYPDVSGSEECIIVGTGPAGLFAALECIQNDYKPILIERGKDVKSRIEDIRNINVRQTVHTDSNYSFGEGGAGTYSDGKLYTRSKKRGNVRKVYELLVGFGADPEILIDAHPHIGTNRLPKIIANIREFIRDRGGEVLFETRVTDLIIEGNPSSGNTKIQGVETRKVIASGNLSPESTIYRAKKVILATGHSARDIFELLYNKNIAIEAKPIAIGVRVEHSQELIDTIQYKRKDRGLYLPPAPYAIVKQVQGRGVYSFCMCPGGVIAPCAPAPDEIVTNGWSSSGRGRPTANSGIVVELHLDDIPG